MNTKVSLGIFKALAWFVSIYHFILGTLAIFTPPNLVLPIISTVYGIVPKIDSQFIYMVKFIGAYMIVFAITTAILASKPLEYRKLVWVPIGLFIIRIFERIVFSNVLKDAFGTTFVQDLRVIIPITVIAIALFVFRPRK